MVCSQSYTPFSKTRTLSWLLTAHIENQQYMHAKSTQTHTVAHAHFNTQQRTKTVLPMAVAQEVELSSEGWRFSLQPLQLTCPSVLRQDTEPQSALGGCSISVWACIYMVLGWAGWGLCYQCMNGWKMTCVVKCFKWSISLEKHYINAVVLPYI